MPIWRYPRIIGAATAVFALALDQVAKQVALVSLLPGVPNPITSFFAFRLGLNQGPAFGMFADSFSGRPLALSAIAMGIVALASIWLWQTTKLRRALALGAIIGGALSNVFDRLRIGAVVDYMDFQIGGYHWPTFNLADAAVVFGVALLLIGDFLYRSDAGA